jgi:type III restriction enzyme
VTVSKSGVDLFDLSGERENYRGYIVGNIHAGFGYIAFTNGVRLTTGQTHGGHSEEAMQIQIRQTITDHFEKELAIATLPENQRMKVLSLFFIDRVANYADEDGKIRRWFIEAYDEIAAQYHETAAQGQIDLNVLPVEMVHNGYFAQDRGKPKDTSGNTKADDEAYALIMRDKERLLSVEEPLRFIFSHSALREGWDNPNVFQICTLNETRSQMKKRQEIGRGMRLPVRVNGERCFDETINKLTVVANESYREFAEKLQTEIAEETGVQFEGRIKNKRNRQVARLQKDWRLNPDFKELWDRIKHRTRYRVEFATEELITGAVKLLKDETRMPAIETPTFVIETAKADLTKEGVATTVIGRSEEAIANYNAPIPDLIGYLQRETELTRSTIAQILIRSGRLDEVKKNPQQFLDQALDAIRTTLKSIMVEGIKYERIVGAEYEMLLFDEKEIEGYLDNMVSVRHSIYDYIVYDSETEREFAEALDARNDIKLFIKLPAWFTIDTPLGTYNPDWAIVKQEDKKLNLVRETKKFGHFDDLRKSEWEKIECGRKHFGVLNVDYKMVQSASEV